MYSSQCLILGDWAQHLNYSIEVIFIFWDTLNSFWLKEEVINEYKNFTISKNSGPSFFLKNFDSTKTDKDGNLQSSLKAKYMKHFEVIETILYIRLAKIDEKYQYIKKKGWSANAINANANTVAVPAQRRAGITRQTIPLPPSC